MHAYKLSVLSSVRSRGYSLGPGGEELARETPAPQTAAEGPVLPAETPAPQETREGLEDPSFLIILLSDAERCVNNMQITQTLNIVFKHE